MQVCTVMCYERHHLFLLLAEHEVASVASLVSDKTAEGLGGDVVDDTGWSGVGLGLLAGVVEGSALEDGELVEVGLVGGGDVAGLGVEVDGGVARNLGVGHLVVAVVELVGVAAGGDGGGGLGQSARDLGRGEGDVALGVAADPVALVDGHPGVELSRGGGDAGEKDGESGELEGNHFDNV